LKIILISLLSLIIGVSIGVFYPRNDIRNEAVFEDNSLQNLLFALAIISDSDSNLNNELKELINVNIDINLTKIREFQGYNDFPEFEASKIRILNSVYLLWEKYKPFTTQKWVESEENKFWFKEWKDNHSKNLELLYWSFNQCINRTEFNCKKI